MKPVTLRTKCRRKLSGHAFHENELVDIVMRRRGVYAKSKMEYSLKNLEHFGSLKDIDKAQSIIADAIMNDKRIMVLADYDCDGATSCTVMVKSLRMMGAKHVFYEIPDRFTMGYGTTPLFVDSFASRKPDVLITVDNGISSFDGIDRIRELLPDAKIVVTDHHMAPKDGSLPNADAIINPNQLDCKFPSKAICGCGVAWYVGLAVRSYMRENGLFDVLGINEPNLATLIDLVALGTVADVVPLDYNNRIMVDVGINYIRNGYGCMGINALLYASEKNPEELKSSDFAFGIGPRINSAGRLHDMRVGVRCLMADDQYKANRYARDLTETNDYRKDLQKTMVNYAHEVVKTMSDDRLSIVIHNPDFNEGVIGLVAARMKESYGVPSFVFSTNEKGVLKASGRSVEGVHLFEVLNEMQERHNQRNNITKREDMMFYGFGGHAMAAGLSLKPEYLDDFTELLDELVKERIPHAYDRVETDGLVDSSLLTFENIKELTVCSPFGQHFPEPVLEAKMQVSNINYSRDGRHIFYKLIDGDNVVDAVAFNYQEREHMFYRSKGFEELEGKTLHLVFRPDINKFRGQESFKMLLESATLTK